MSALRALAPSLAPSCLRSAHTPAGLPASLHLLFVCFGSGLTGGGEGDDGVSASVVLQPADGQHGSAALRYSQESEDDSDDDEDEEDEGGEENHVFLSKQPSCIKFGQLKP